MDHFIMMDRSRDLSTIEKTFAQGRIMHLQSIFHYGDFINATIREWFFYNILPIFSQSYERNSNFGKTGKRVPLMVAVHRSTN